MNNWDYSQDYAQIDDRYFYPPASAYYPREDEQ